MVAQTETIQRLQKQLIAVQFEQQANSTSTVGGSVSSRISASISIGVTQESMKAMFKLWTATQAGTSVPRTTRMTAKEKQKRKFAQNYIEYDLPNDERTKRQYPETTNY